MKVLSTRRISSEIEEIISSANRFILIVSPYLKISASLYERMLYKLDEGIQIVLLYGKQDTNLKMYPLLRDHKNISIYFLNDLHAKIYSNEDQVLVASMNLHLYSEVNNWEIGLCTDNQTEEYEEIIKEALFMLKSSRHKFGIDDFSIIKQDDEIALLINKIKSVTSNFKYEQTIISSYYNDDDEYSFKATYEPNKKIEITFYFNHLLVSFDNENDFKKVTNSIDHLYEESDFRYFTKKTPEFTIYPPAGFNRRLNDDEMEDEEYEAKWCDIFSKLESVLDSQFLSK